MTTANIEQQSFQLLYLDHHAWLRGWLQHKLGNREDAADIAHDTFLRIMARRSTAFIGNEPRAFLTHIAKGLVVDHWRRQDVEKAYLEAISHLPAAEAPSAETRFIILETLYRIDRMLRELPAQTRHIFLMSQLDGHTYPRIAEQLGIAVITVKRHMRIAFLNCLQFYAD